MHALKAFHVDDETIYAALDADQASVLYMEDTGAECDAPDYPRELTDAELDVEVPELDSGERHTGRTTCVRAFLGAATARHDRLQRLDRFWESTSPCK
jgi:hypothetical protein